MINIFLLIFSGVCAWLTVFLVKLIRYKPLTKPGIGIVTKTYNDGHFIHYYAKFSDGDKEYIGESEPYIFSVDGNRYYEGDSVSIGYYFTKGGPWFVIHDKTLKEVKISVFAPIFTACLSIMFLIIFVYKMIPYFL